MNQRRIYVDHAATTPMREEAIAAMLPYFSSVGFNASSVHTEGRAARAALDNARELVASLLGARPRELVFTGGGTEADALAIGGTIRAARAAGRRELHAISVRTEHHAVLHAFDALREDGVEITLLGVDDAGRIDPAAFAAAIRPQTVLASIMLANNELGTIAPIAELAAIACERGVIFHTDAIQCAGHLPLDVAALGVDLLSLSAHKFYGPKGVGLTYVRSGTVLEPLIRGGGQEAGLRSGTENVAGIVGFARAFELAVHELPEESTRLRALRDAFETALRERIADVRVNAADARRAPHVTSIAFAGTDASELLARLDLDGVAVSGGSACAAGALEASHVLAAIGSPPWVREGTIRFSFGKLTTQDDLETLVSSTVAAVAAVRDVPREVGTEQGGSSARFSEVRS